MDASSRSAERENQQLTTDCLATPCLDNYLHVEQNLV
jgi:hypothetical protein